ncbi:MAG TPA: hypothetical protein VKB59_10220 [Micromonosporaceae bacterium]|nr:hypothetical protein [Micromonosporaceae bacterium]
MVSSIEDLVRDAFANEELRHVVTAGDWYLVGSRATGFDDELSDWDTIVLSRADPSADDRRTTSRSRLDQIFRVDRPSDALPSYLGRFRAVRRAQGVEINVYGPAGRTHRDGDGAGDVIWAYDLRHAVALCVEAGVGEPYRRQVAAAFAQRCRALRDAAYLRFRMARNEVAATLARSDRLAQELAAARCVRNAARFWLLAREEPYPADKWLPSALARDPAAGELMPLIRVVLDGGADPSARFDATWSLWRTIDDRAVGVGADPELLSGSPFVS